jgi:predicted Zn-dependent peptidase
MVNIPVREKDTIKYEQYGSRVHVLTTVAGALGNSKRASANVIFTNGGAFYEDGVPIGTSHVLEHVMAATIRQTTPEDFERMKSNLSIESNAATNELTLATEAHGHVDDIDIIWDIVKQISFFPDLLSRSQILEQERRRIKAELHYHNGNPQREVNMELMKAVYMYGSFRLANVGGTPESIETITLDDLVNRYNQIRATGHIVIAVSNIQEKQRKNVKKLAERLAYESEGITDQTAINGIPPLEMIDFVYLPFQHPKATDRVDFLLHIPAPSDINEVAARDFTTRFILGSDHGLNGFLQRNLGHYVINTSYDKQAGHYILGLRTTKQNIVPTAEAMLTYIGEESNIGSHFTLEVFNRLKRSYIKEIELSFDDIVYKMPYVIGALLSQGEFLTPLDYIEAIKRLRYNDVFAWLEKLRTGIYDSRMIAVSNSSDPMEIEEEILNTRANILAKVMPK